MLETNPPAKPPRKFSYFLLLNVVLAIALLSAVPLLRTGQDSYEPHASIDHEYVKNVIAGGQPEVVNTALKLTEYSRAVAYSDYVKMLTVMQVIACLLAVMVVANIFIFSKARQQALLPAPIQPEPQP